ncbi:MAG TPA: DUF366 family protein [Planctomycetota bacterium]|nr:DUF366 family protein [Planctomycetota bacterium]
MALRRLRRAVSFEPRQDYDGTQLRPHFLRKRFGVTGDAAVAFRGRCDVRGDALLDLADREAGAFIVSADMVHVIVERFEVDLVRGVLVQRLLAARCADRVRAATGRAVERRGDDVYVDGRKLNVSLATVSATSTLIHFGVNVDPAGAPVPAVGLAELKVDPAAFAEGLLDDLDRELEGVAEAASKAAAAHGGPGA